MFRTIKLLFFVAALCAISCNGRLKSGSYVMVEGFAQGTTWHITYKSFNGEDLKPQIDSILAAFDRSMSAYNKESQLTKINNNDSTIVVDRFFKEIFDNSLHLYNISGKAFDPTVSPLVSLWGFGKHKDMRRPSQNEIDSVLEFVGLDKVKIQDGKVIKTDPRITLIFNANAQGYSVDEVSRWFDSLGYTDYLVEIGGEVFAKGVNASGQQWRVGIDSPIDGSTEEDRVIQAVVSLSGKNYGGQDKILAIHRKLLQLTIGYEDKRQWEHNAERCVQTRVQDEQERTIQEDTRLRRGRRVPI